MTLRIVPRPLEGRALVRDYLAGAGEAGRFYAGSPADLAAYRRRWEEVSPRFDRAARERAARALTPTSPAAEERLRRFVQEGGGVVTTGQQAGLFTGPLYTVYKALTAIRLAGSLERELGILVLPVFWVASEDHDWAEVDHTHVVGAAGAVHRIEVGAADPRRIPIAERALLDDVESALDELAQCSVTQKVDADSVREFLGAYRAGAPVAGAFAATLSELFAPFGLLLTDAADPELKAASVPVLRRELDGAADHERQLRRRTDRLLDAGYHEQVTLIPGATNLFLRTPAGRERLMRRGGEWVTRETRTPLSRAEADTLLEREPGRLSPNALLRPVVESAVFPVLSYVGGPGEIAYLAQARPLFDTVGVGMPVIAPRASFVLVEPRVERSLASLGLGLDDLSLPGDELLTRLVRERIPEDVADAVKELRAAVAERYAALLHAATRVDPTLAGPIGTARNLSLLQAEDAERKIVRRLRRVRRDLSDRLDEVRGALLPLGEPQERVLNPVPFLAAEGTGLLTRLLDAIDPPWAARPPEEHATPGSAAANRARETRSQT